MLQPLFPWWDKSCIAPEPTRSTGARPSEWSRPAQPPRSGCLDRLGSGRATIASYALAACRVFGRAAAHQMWSPRRPPISPAPALSEEARRGGYRDACSIARSHARTIGRVFDTPPRDTRSPDWARDRPALPADPALPVEHGPKAPRADLCALRRVRGLGVMLRMCPELPRRSGRQLCQSHSNANSCVEAKWRRGVGRHARQSGGGILRSDKHLSLP